MKNNQFVNTWRSFGFKVAFRNWMLSNIQRKLRLKSLTVEYIGKKDSGLITRFNPSDEIFSYEIQLREKGIERTILQSKLGQGDLTDSRTFNTFMNHFKAEVQSKIENPSSSEILITLNRVTYPSGIGIRKEFMRVVVKPHKVLVRKLSLKKESLKITGYNLKRHQDKNVKNRVQETSRVA